MESFWCQIELSVSVGRQIKTNKKLSEQKEMKSQKYRRETFWKKKETAGDPGLVAILVGEDAKQGGNSYAYEAGCGGTNL